MKRATNMSELLVNMVQNGATAEELERAVKHSAIVIDLDRSYEQNGIEELIKKYANVKEEKEDD